MARLIVRRLLFALLTLLATSVLVFAATEILPGDVASAILGQNATPELLAGMRERLGLDAPAHLRYLAWLGAFISGDMGRSLATNAPVAEVLRPRVLNTLGLAAYAAVVGIPLSLALGIASAAWYQSVFDRVLSSATVFLVAVPEFVIAILLVTLLAVELRLFPSIAPRPRWSDPPTALWQLFLPMATVVCTMLAHMIRMTRAVVLDVLATPYVEMALLKGASKSRIILRHALPNAIGPVLSVIALNLGYLISGIAIVEVVFSFPGLGKLMVDSIFYRDLPLVQATAMIFCAGFILFNTVADISAVALNPRVRQRR
ncbi:MAG: ABC transporter permease [Dongiaceae bacterium]